MLRMWITAAAGLVAGCSVFVPFEQEFSCTADRNYGKCTNVEGAYSEALGGSVGDVRYVGEDDVAKGMKKQRGRKARASDDEQFFETPEERRSVNRYKQAQYDELAKIIRDPVTPVVKPPDVLRTLVVAYATGEDKTLWMPRYIFYFASDAGFVYGDYLSTEKPLTPPTLQLNGGR